MSRSIINVVCLKWGTKYGVEYVNKLYSAISKNTKVAFRFHCYTDDTSGLNKKIITHDLPYKHLEGWWNKLYLFSDEIGIPNGERIFYVDLDTLITRNIDSLMTVKSSKITVLKDFMFGIAKSATTVGSGLMSWNHGSHTNIWNAFIADPEAAVEMMTPHGDQAWVEHMVLNWTVVRDYHLLPLLSVIMEFLIYLIQQLNQLKQEDLTFLHNPG